LRPAGYLNAADIRKHAAELAAQAPDVIVASGSSTIGPLLRATRTDANQCFGFVESLSRPGGNATGFMSFEFSLGGKWLELLTNHA
jgi:putative ABC transport system substrate-binding protein